MYIPPKYKELKKLGYCDSTITKQNVSDIYNAFCFYGSKFEPTATTYNNRYGFRQPTKIIFAVLDYYKENPNEIDSGLSSAYQAVFMAYNLMSAHTKQFLQYNPRYIKVSDKHRYTLSNIVYDIWLNR